MPRPAVKKHKAKFTKVEERVDARHGQYVFTVTFDVLDPDGEVSVNGESVEVRVALDNEDVTSRAIASAEKLVKTKLKNRVNDTAGSSSVDEAALETAINKVTHG